MQTQQHEIPDSHPILIIYNISPSDMILESFPIAPEQPDSGILFRVIYGEQRVLETLNQDMTRT